MGYLAQHWIDDGPMTRLAPGEQLHVATTPGHCPGVVAPDEALRRRVRPGAAEYVGIPEPGKAILLGRRLWHAGATVERHPPGVDGRTVIRSSDVVPDCRAVVVGRHRVDVVAQELVGEGVRAGASGVAGRAAIELRERPDMAVGRHLGVLNDADEGTRGGRVLLVGREKRVVDEIDVLPVRRDRDGGVVAAVARTFHLFLLRPVLTAVARRGEEDVL